MTVQINPENIACNATVLQQSWNLLAQARFGHSNFEYGAFIVRDEHGQLQLRVWKNDHESLRAHFTGAIPPDVVAITHTHPNALPMPSDDDVELARRTGLPVFVLTRMLITVTNGHGGRIVVSSDWRPLQFGDQVTEGCDTTAPK